MSPQRDSRTNTLLAAGLSACAFVLAVHSLRRSPDLAIVAQAWPATALTTVVLLITPRRHLRTLAGLVAALFLVAGLVAGRDVLFSVGFALANAVEALIVLHWLSDLEEDRPPLRSWADYRRWLLGITVGASAAGVITALTIGIGGGQDLWRPLIWITVTHVGAQTVVLPLFMRQADREVHLSPLEIVSHLALLAACAFACASAGPSEPVAFLLLPVLMWAAARFTPRWANLELLAMAFGLALLSDRGIGPFDDLTGRVSLQGMAASSQAFVTVSAVTAVAFSVAMGHVQDSLRRIRENEAQLSQLLDSASGTAFIATDMDGLITWFSPGAEQLLGYTADEVVGRLTPMPFHELREVLVRARELGIEPGYGVVTHEIGIETEQDTRDWTYVRRDGSRLTVSLSVTAVRDDDGVARSYLSVVRDVTDRRAAEQALVFALDKERETNKRMLELDHAKGDFVSSVSHELRTPLTSIVGYCELLAEDLSDNLTGQQQQLVERIDRNGERLLHLVEDLLTLARVEDGQLSLERIETDLREAVVTATEEVSHSAHKGRVALHVSVPPDPVPLMGDPAYLDRLVLNLLSNAVKFTPAGGSVDVLLEVSGEVAELRVVDTGMGIPLEEQGRLFERFFRSSLATTNAIQGTGLGLNIVRSIAEAHNGHVACESTPGVGTTFTVTVPLMARPAPASPPARHRAPEPAREPQRS